MGGESQLHRASGMGTVSRGVNITVPRSVLDKMRSSEQNYNGTAFESAKKISNVEKAFSSWEGPAFVLMGFISIPPWVVGLLLGMTGYSICGLGMNVIRLSHLVSNPNGSSSLRETKFNRKASRGRALLIWISGYVLNATGGFMNIIGLRFAAQSLMAPLSSVALIANAVFATILLGERLVLTRDAPPMVLIALGNALTVSSANHKGYHHLSIDEFFRLFTRSTFQRYLFLGILSSVALTLLRYHLWQLVRRRGGREYASQTLVARMGLCHAAAGCILCVNSVILSKGSMLILSQGMDRALQPRFAVIIFCWIFLVLLWLHTLNRLLADYDALYIIPVIEVLWSLQSMIGGGIFFEEYSTLGIWRLLLFVLGVFVNVSGVLVLSQRGEKHKLAE
uniref:Uncharacterized protein n=1 Tax=Compsopogon caeruleus TaxID=31354 RepID=A0A6T6B3B2_9RHOD